MAKGLEKVAESLWSKLLTGNGVPGPNVVPYAVLPKEARDQLPVNGPPIGWDVTKLTAKELAFLRHIVNQQPLPAARLPQPRQRQAMQFDPATRTIAGVPIADDDRLSEWLQSELEARDPAGETKLAEVAPTVSSRRRYALALLRQKMGANPRGGNPRAQRKVQDAIAGIRDLDLEL